MGMENWREMEGRERVLREQGVLGNSNRRIFERGDMNLGFPRIEE